MDVKVYDDYIQIDTKPFLIEFRCQWVQFFDPKRYNWIDFNFVTFHFERDQYIGQTELELFLLGFGIRLSWIHDEKKTKKFMDFAKKQMFLASKE